MLPKQTKKASGAGEMEGPGPGKPVRRTPRSEAGK